MSPLPLTAQHPDAGVLDDKGPDRRSHRSERLAASLAEEDGAR